MDKNRYHPKSKKYRQLERLEKLRQIRDKAVRAGLVEHGLSPVRVLQRLIDDAFVDYSMEQTRIRELEAQGVRTTTSKLQRLRKEAAYYASLAMQYNIADRQTKAQEAQTQLLATLLQQTLRHPDINLSEAKIKKIPALLEEQAQSMQRLADAHNARRGDYRDDPQQASRRLAPHEMAS
jgi:hypothetical protein